MDSHMRLQFKITYETGVTFETLERLLGRRVNARHVVVVIAVRKAAFLFRMRVVNECFATLTLVTIKISKLSSTSVLKWMDDSFVFSLKEICFSDLM